ncbi:hypothetical protein SDRG_15493 [Saprolegnia diclina VS20]|uniref:F-box domain-containing protein n=1 Tax=Saprolegnia diclina (strain VS20) TaxID=1156394 RepID=T0PZX4_SAPDV|nr:hypothetical protein SDRG_15493 [Saprolegnia diclina VS20]EQC26655.1 hypothetical protein SDRG_15493 [Saprolegnia diclina VS20]|eukprot:XP_008619890.1 hypothetical protein SDRG_15493 [Saprolegnia diclina VS20]
MGIGMYQSALSVFPSMADEEERKTKKGRATPPDGLLFPHVIEAVATSLDTRDGFAAFLDAVPRSLWTPALTAFVDVCSLAPSYVYSDWPHLMLTETADLPHEVLPMLVKTLPLRLCIDVECEIYEAAPLVQLVPSIGPALSYISLVFNDTIMVDGQGQTIANLLLEQCPCLRELLVDVAASRNNNHNADERVELSNLLAAVAHPRVEQLSVSLLDAHATPRLGHYLASWLSTAPTTGLSLRDVAHMDDDAAIAFCDALQANTTLTELSLHRVVNILGFRGRTLPPSLDRFEFDARFHNLDVNDATIEHLAIAVGATKLEHFGCSVFGRVAQCPAAAPMLAQLQSLEVHGLRADGVEALVAGLSTVPALISLVLGKSAMASEDAAVQLMDALATSCTHLTHLNLNEHGMRRDGVAAVLAATPRLPQLTSLDVSPSHDRMKLHELLCVLMELVAAGRHVQELSFQTIKSQNGRRATLVDSKEDKRAVLRALAMIQDVPFVVDRFPVDVEPHVVEALGATADRAERCTLNLYF